MVFTVVYSIVTNATWKTIKILVGVWNVNDLTNKIKIITKQNNDNEKIQKSVLVDKNEYKINLALAGGCRVN